MALDLMHAGGPTGRRRRRRRRGWSPPAAAAASLRPCSPTGSTRREVRGIDAAELRQAGDRPPGLRQGLSPVRRRAAPGRDRSGDDAGRPETVAELIDENTVAIVGSAGNYGYGTVDPIGELAELATERGVGMHVDGCLGGYLLPFGEELGLPIPLFDFRVPGVTSISADTHKYGYALKGTSTLLFRDKELRNRSTSSCRTGAAASTSRPASRARARAGCSPRPGPRWSRSGARATASYAKRDLRDRGGDAGRRSASHPELRIMGEPTFSSPSPPTSSTSTTSTTR